MKGKPTVLIANTVKGCGSPVMENKAAWHHKFPQPRNTVKSSGILKKERRPCFMNKIPNRKAICDTLMEAAKEDKDIVVLCSDSRVPHP